MERVDQAVSPGDEVEVLVTKIDGRNVGLSMKEAQAYAKERSAAAESDDGGYRLYSRKPLR